MEFIFKAKKSINEISEGKISADSLEQAIELLGRQGLVPIVVEPENKEEMSGNAAAAAGLGNLSFKKITLWTQKLYSLIKSHVELLSALKLLQGQSNDATEKMLLENIINNIKQGMTFSQALSRYPRFFSPLYISLIRIGESSGQLKDTLEQLLSYMQRLEELRVKIRQALAYPIFMVVVGAGTIFVMLTFVLPRLAAMFEDFQASLPLPTLIMLKISNMFKQYWVIILLLPVVIFLSLRKMAWPGDKLFSFIKYHLPIIRDLMSKQCAANFADSLALLLKSGVNLLSALGIAAPIIGNPEHIALLEEVRGDIEKGSSFSRALAKFKIFPVFFTQMIQVGEQSGRLDKVLADLADSYQQEIEADLKIISALIEPAIILILGLLIGGMVIAVLLPIFNINALVGG